METVSDNSPLESGGGGGGRLDPPKLTEFYVTNLVLLDILLQVLSI